MQKNKQVKRRKWPYILIAVILLAAAAVVGLGAFFRSRLANAQNQVSSVLIKKETITLTAYGSGSIAAGQTEPLYAPADALVEQVNVANGDRIQKDAVLAVLSSESLDLEISKLETTIAGLDSQIRLLKLTAGSSSITAPAAGRLMILYAAAGQPVAAVMDQHDALCVLSADGKMKVELTGVQGLKPGDPVIARIGSESANGLVMRVQNDVTTIEIDGDHYPVDAGAAILNKSGQAVGQGILKINKPVYVTAGGGVIESVSHKIGDKVSKDTRLFRLKEAGYSTEYIKLIDDREQAQADLQAARDRQETLVLRAPAAGIISQLKLVEKALVKENGLVCNLEIVSSLKMDVQIDELDIARVAEGQTAVLQLAALDYRSYPATVGRISAIGTTSGGVTTYPVTLNIEPAEGILIGMSAGADILVASKANVLTVPLNSLKVDGSRVYVTVMQRTAARVFDTRDQDVTIGLVNGTQAEILSGLSEGDEILTVNSASNPFGQFGMGGFRQPRDEG